MPQRHRPRLKHTLIRCDQCGSTAMKFVPSRERVRARLSPYHFCSSTCQREHWEARRKAEWVAESYPCRQCGATLTTQQAPGRRRDYCSAACKQKAARERSRRHPAGAVVAARQRFHEAWRQAVAAAAGYEQIRRHGLPVLQAYSLWRELGEETEEERAITEVFNPFRKYTISAEARADILKKREDRRDARRRISKEIRGLAGPLYRDEPVRAKVADESGSISPSAYEWMGWANRTEATRRGAYEQRLHAAREATADLRKCERVAARRAETARLRRAAGKSAS